MWFSLYIAPGLPKVVRGPWIGHFISSLRYIAVFVFVFWFFVFLIIYRAYSFRITIPS